MEERDARWEPSSHPEPAAWPITPLPTEAFDAAAAELHATLAEGTRDLNLTRTLLHHPALLRVFTGFGMYFLEAPLLSVRDRELLVLRLAWLCRCEYVWGQHVALCRREGLSDLDFTDIIAGADAVGWSPRDRALVRTVDELDRDATLSEEAGRALAELYDPPRILEAIFTVGQYALICRIANSCAIPLDSGLSGFPERV